jgi:hypothetical protein
MSAGSAARPQAGDRFGRLGVMARANAAAIHDSAAVRVGDSFAGHSAVVPRAADGCIARMIRKPTGASLASALHSCFRRPSGCWCATISVATVEALRRLV